MIKLFFDCEFTGLHKETTLISLGIISENDDNFYAEFNDYNKSQVDNWIQKNVIDKLWVNRKNIIEQKAKMPDYYFYGSKKEIVIELKKWLNKFNNEEILFVSDVCHYDFVLLIDLFGTAFDLPKNVCPACYDINNDLIKYFNKDARKAFNVTREDLLDKKINSEALKHNALWDAEIIKELYYKYFV